MTASTTEWREAREFWELPGLKVACVFCGDVLVASGLWTCFRCGAAWDKGADGRLRLLVVRGLSGSWDVVPRGCLAVCGRKGRGRGW